VVVHVRKAREGGREVPADLLPELVDVGVGGAVAALVLGLGVDDQAVGALRDGGGSPLGLSLRMSAVDVLPGADSKPLAVEVPHEAGRELAPRVGAVGALYVERPDAVALGLAGDLGELAAARLVHVPDPHAVAAERIVGLAAATTVPSAARPAARRRSPGGNDERRGDHARRDQAGRGQQGAPSPPTRGRRRPGPPPACRPLLGARSAHIHTRLRRGPRSPVTRPPGRGSIAKPASSDLAAGEASNTACAPSSCSGRQGSSS
jgi:hypothetical protein